MLTSSNASAASSPRGVLPRVLLCGGLGLSLSLGCDDSSRPLPRPDPAGFRELVYPTLLRDCAFAGCHGDPRRPLFVPGPGRTRLDPTTELMGPPTADELQVAYDRTRGLLGPVRTGNGEETMPFLLEKTRAGAGHQGLDRHGQNVYEDPDAPGASALRRWLNTAGDE